jgi:hypothetical protein
MFAMVVTPLLYELLQLMDCFKADSGGTESLPFQKRLIYTTPRRQRMFFWLRYF